MSDNTTPSQDDVIDFFLKLTQTELPRLVAIFSPGFVKNPDRQRLIHYTLDTLIQASGEIGLLNLTRLFTELRDNLPRSWPMPDEARRRMISLVTEIRRLAEVLEVEEGLGVYTGSRDLAESLDETIHGEIFQNLLELSGHLHAMVEETAPELFIPLYAKAADSAANIWQLMECSGNHLCTPLVLMAADLLHRAANSHLAITPALANLLVEGLALVEQTFRASRNGESGPSTDLLEEHLQKIRTCLQVGGQPAKSEKKAPTLPLEGIDPGLRETLTARHLEELHMAILQGWQPVQVYVDMENAPQVAEGFIQWLASHARIISNRSILQQGHTSFLFLLVTRHQREQLDLWFREIDPSGDYLYVVTP